MLSDLRILGHVPDWRALTSVEFCTLVERMPFYSGAIRGVILAKHNAAAARERAWGAGGAPSGGTEEAPVMVDDDALLQQLANEGWAEHRVEG